MASSAATGINLSRRDFLMGSAAAAIPLGAFGQGSRLTAGAVVERIKTNLGVPWRGGPTDTFKSGDAESPVTGIATSVMSTFEVLRRAAADGKNMVITHEPTFWTGNDDVRNFTNDALYKEKLQFIREKNLVIWRFHDHLHAQRPDMSFVGLAQDLGWEKFASKDDPQVFVLPRVRLRELASDVERRMKVKTIRVIGDPNAWVSRACLMQGAPPFPAATMLAKADVVVCGEQREWEGVEYAFDAMSAGMPKGMIVIGHWVSEEPAMRLCADWLKTFITEVPVAWIPAGDPFWRP